MKMEMEMHLKAKLTWQAMIQEGSDIRKAICKTVQANHCVKVNVSYMNSKTNENWSWNLSLYGVICVHCMVRVSLSVCARICEMSDKCI